MRTTIAGENAPLANNSWRSPRDKFAADVTILCDLANLDTSDLWDVVSEPPQY
ncbi:MAG: hypothetical protein ABI693_02405 [Bryobacteraceae bacterium]